MEDTRVCYVVAYWGDVEDVRYTSSEYTSESNKLFDAMEDYITRGYVTEILDVVWGVEDCYPTDIDNRCDRWREVLREQGYEVEEKF